MELRQSRRELGNVASILHVDQWLECASAIVGKEAGVDARDFKVILPVLQHVEAMAQHIEALSQILSQILNILSQIVNRGLESVLQVLNDIGDTVGVLNGGHVGHAL